jgi:hypothetical protein
MVCCEREQIILRMYRCWDINQALRQLPSLHILSRRNGAWSAFLTLFYIAHVLDARFDASGSRRYSIPICSFYVPLSQLERSLLQAASYLLEHHETR